MQTTCSTVHLRLTALTAVFTALENLFLVERGILKMTHVSDREIDHNYFWQSYDAFILIVVIIDFLIKSTFTEYLNKLKSNYTILWPLDGWFMS